MHLSNTNTSETRIAGAALAALATLAVAGYAAGKAWAYDAAVDGAEILGASRADDEEARVLAGERMEFCNHVAAGLIQPTNWTRTVRCNGRARR